MSRDGRHLFTSESVTEGHPDKIADQISDAILDAILAQDPVGRVACETLVTTGLAMIAGEITTSCYVDFPKIVRETIKEIGYTRAKYGFDSDTCAVLSSIHEQSPDIAMGVDPGGAGDQGLMFGYACRETDELMPMPIMLAHKLAMQLSAMRKQGVLPYLGPDGKTQVTVEYQDGKPIRVDYVVIAASHTDEVITADGKFTTEEAKKQIIEKVVYPVLGNLIDKNTKITVNGTGKFMVSGPQCDTGMTGRKIMVDTYGGWAVHGGGAFSGKDATKVDRSAGYMSRYIAKNLVAAGLADECLVQLGYCIGLVDPVSVMVNTYGTGKINEKELAKIVRKVFPLSPKGMIDHLKLRTPFFLKTATFGHFGRPEFTWEKLDAQGELLAWVNKSSV